MRFGLKVNAGTWSEAQQWAGIAEEVGFDGLWMVRPGEGKRYRIGNHLWRRSGEIHLNARAIATKAVGDMKILLKMILQWKIDERRAGRRKFHAGGEPALNQRKIAGREVAVEIGDESPHLNAVGSC